MKDGEMSNQQMKNMFNLDGKVAVITGGGGALGAGIAKAYALRGADIVVTGRTQETLDNTVEMVEDIGQQGLAVTGDVTVEADVKNVMDKAVEKFGKINILVTVAGLALRHPAEEFPPEDYEKVLDINVKGTFLSCKHAGKVMMEQGQGKIVTVSSIRANLGHPGGYGAYAPSKGAINTLTKQLAIEWVDHNIQVNSLAPAIFWTPLTQEVLEDEELKQIFLDSIPMGRAAVVDDMVGTAVYLASSASDFVTGEIIYVDGGSNVG